MPQYSFLPFLQPFPIATRILTGLLITLSLGQVLLTGLNARFREQEGKTFEGINENAEVPYLLCVPGAALPWYFWTFLTAGFVEIKPIEFIISLISIPLLTRYLERVWGPKELLRFSAVVIVASNIIGFGLCWLEFFVLGGREVFLTGEPVRGSTALLTGYLVAYTQLIPEHQVQIFGRLKIRVKNTPGIALLASNILTLVHSFQPWILIQFGFIVAFWYLRFFQVHAESDIRGDRSETFAFIYWFPPPVRPYTGYIGNVVFNLAVKFKLVQPWDGPQTGAYAMLPTSGSGGAGGAGTRAEAERRRALALQALDARVTKPTTGEASTSAPPPTAAGTTATAASGEAVTVTAPAEAVTKAEKANDEEIKAS
ncbi:hypothetical protein FFLO_02734 [Filobasidium floriforme]|uniref:DUF1751-domain-containing protein n=1 Tax=Filobasidium floriforme TaxID=5210 RepID=A0A8K0JM49_9TREE|nr:eukaryotic integral membrane protein-domain-containing protein [Filobasidium floriforme]KAG7561833.1 hypothetical protein FFLO_02734 [Filobasidium floriforme]KAH8083231.1 eukaryotic integral membrane protein-domain-containing protein [Filobasidium floriforme]